MSARTDASRLAKDWLQQKPLFIDTETTGLNDRDEICDLAVMDHDGALLLDTLVHPTISIPYGATNVHHITNEMVKGAPAFGDIWLNLRQMLEGRLVVIYNLDYDLPRLIQSARANKIDAKWLKQVNARGEPGWHCAMKLYAQFYGQAGNYGSYRWQKLEVAARQCGLQLPSTLHRARADAELARQIVAHMANA